ncbi:helix-turn-helix domain-containing protein [Salmonella enterica]|nr:helix-turn-helix domain-containing protein [Salmonella enterica]EBL7700968.1 helix-turn-helix domain-containing protein [Salmonella enterica]EDU6134330.1 helix-turn-helix domain-containing protein [Salmonella enterica subsp. enterica]EHO4422330.1 helix-turn-helix domain-containing protein [Salmonella enterica]
MKVTQGVGERIRERRNELGLTQKEIAKHLGRSASAVTQWEIGATLPNGLNLVKLAEILQVDAQWILSGEHDEEAKSSVDWDNWYAAGALQTPVFTWEEAGNTTDSYDAISISATHRHILTATGGDYEYVLKAKKNHIPQSYEVYFPDNASIVIDCSKTAKLELEGGKFILVKANKPDSKPVIRRVIDDGVSLYLEPIAPGLVAHELDDHWIILGIVRQVIIDM